MEKRKDSIGKPDKNLAAVCGLFCEACTLYIATQEDPARLKKLAAQFGISEEEVPCRGCRSEKRVPYCRICHMAPCAALNSAYDAKCRKSGAEPSCKYVARHGEAIREFLSRR